MQSTNFLPGMNPFLQVRWPDAHTRLIAYISDALNERVPSDLTVLAEESISIDSTEPDQPSEIRLRPDVSVMHQSTIRIPDSLASGQDESTIAVAQPTTVRVSMTHRWLEIRDLDSQLITVIELLSPSNKTPVGASNMARRNERLIRSGVNVVEIDLIRGGFRTVPELMAAEFGELDDHTTYLVIVGKASIPEERQVYYCPLRQRLPAFMIPLRPTDFPVPLDLQPLVDRCYEAGRYWQVSQRPLPLPTLSADEQAWLNQQLLAAELI